MSVDDGAPVRSVRLEREAARVLLLDSDDAVLLMRGFDPALPDRRIWFTVGGGLEDGEDDVTGALREIYEETGLRVAREHVVGPLHSDHAEFGFAEYWVVQPQRYYAVRVPDGWTPQPAALEETEAATVDRWAWWTPEDLRAHEEGRSHSGPGLPGETVYPRDLLAVLDRARRAL